MDSFGWMIHNILGNVFGDDKSSFGFEMVMLNLECEVSSMVILLECTDVIT